ncbi:MAG: SixA phosphatase family protein [Mongoliitalea sp.]
MKKLLLIRHAKSSWENLFLSDHARPLALRGLRDAPIMGLRLKDKNVSPDLVISSDAERAKETAFLISKILDYPKQKVVLTKELYHASALEMLAVIRQAESAINTLFLFGHNPGMNDLMWKLKGTMGNLPTTGIFAVKAAIADWKYFDVDKVEFWFEDYPKKLG